jgi:TatA/E family protein of Tat protein translocase
MPNIGPVELVIILVVALLVIGPGKLPDVGAALGKSIREFRKAATDVQESVKLDAPAAPAAPTTPPAPAAQSFTTPAAPAPAPAPAAPVAPAPGVAAPVAQAPIAASTPDASAADALGAEAPTESRV